LTTRQPQTSPATTPVFQGGVLVATGPANNDGAGSGGKTGASLQSRQASKQAAPIEGVTFTHEKLERVRAFAGCPPAQSANGRRTK
jgi:hypothetical protein